MAEACLHHRFQPSRGLLDSRCSHHIPWHRITAGFLYRAGAETPLNFREKFGNGPNTVSGSTVSNTELSELFWAHWVQLSELSEFLSAYYLCANANSPSFLQNSPSLPQNSVSCLLRNSTLETVFRPFPKNSECFPERFWKISQRWIPKPQFWYPPLRLGSQHRIPKHLFFLVFWVSTADFGFLPGDEKFRIVSWGACHEIRVSAPAPYKNPTVTGCLRRWVALWKPCRCSSQRFQRRLTCTGENPQDCSFFKSGSLSLGGDMIDIVVQDSSDVCNPHFSWSATSMSRCIDITLLRLQEIWLAKFVTTGMVMPGGTSEKKKAHEHKCFWPVTPPVRGAHQGGHATARFLEGFLEGAWKGLQ